MSEAPAGAVAVDPGDATTATVAILADDLIWATRLERIVATAGARPTTAADAPAFARALVTADAAIVDLAARRADPIEAIVGAVGAGRPVMAVGPHEDLARRRLALAAGADRVFAYSKLHEDGPRTVAGWLRRTAPATAQR